MQEGMIRGGFLALASLIVGASGIVACGDDEPTECELETPAETASADGMVTYQADTMGDAYITSVVYESPDGPMTIVNPESPYEVTVSVEEGDVLGVTVIASRNAGGSITAGYVFEEADDNDPVEVTVSCPE